VSDLARLLPDGFAQSYWDAFGELPPADFLEAYELLCDTLYNGARIAPEPGNEGKHGKRYHTGWWFGEPQLLGLKEAIDRRASAIRTGLRRWTAARARQAARRPRPAADG
jgi:hypothetical protein